MSAVNVRTFRPVKVYASKNGHCPACGKPTNRRRVFEHTLSPFNCHPDGRPRTFDEVRTNVRAEAEAWVPDFRHNTVKCADTGDTV